MAIIKTPDQRLRVFISSTINELADERKAAREAISNLRLTPVFFEAGARPHPPRDLYAAYLDQSHIFLGIYWNSYGWIAPGAEISGLEDEYRLCGKKPKLIYVKRSEERQDRLINLLQDIEKSEAACYQQFSTAEELQKLIENDLSLLISEIFENALAEQPAQPVTEPEIQVKKYRELPVLKTRILGREKEIEVLSRMLFDPDISLITLIGSGGSGKTTLSIFLAGMHQEQFKHGVVFVPLAPVTDYIMVPQVIAQSLGLQDSGKQSVEETLADFLSDKNLLLVLDNFEQVIEASKTISNLLTVCQHLRVLVTSRTPLHIRFEHLYNLSTLELPDDSEIIQPEMLKNYPATELFIQRALAVNQHLPLNQENAEAIVEICRRMDGLPLAIELAAARTRFFQPAALLSRISKSLDLVNKGQSDLPERQQTLRAAIDWSYNLCEPQTQKVFRQLGIFKRSWTLESADAVIRLGPEQIDIEEITERLLDVSLIKPVLASNSIEPRFNMLQTVHEYAREMLDCSEESEATKRTYASYYYRLLIESENQLWGGNAEPWLDRIELEMQNIRASFYISLEQGNKRQAWEMFYFMVPYWTIRGGFNEGLQWIRDAGIHEGVEPDEQLDSFTMGRTLTWAAFTALMMMQIQDGFAMLHRAEEFLQQESDSLQLSFCYLMDGCYGSFFGFPDSGEKTEKAFQMVEAGKNPLALGFFYCWSYEYYRQIGQPELMHEHIRKAAEIAAQNNMIYILGCTYIIQFSLSALNPDHDYKITEQTSLEMIRLFPEKGYKGLKAAAYQGYAYALIKLNRLDEAGPILRQGLEFTRECGEKESEFYGVLESAGYYCLRGNLVKAAELFGSVDHFLTETGYPLIGAGLIQYEEVKSMLNKELVLPNVKSAYESGQRIAIRDAVIIAQREMSEVIA